MKRRKSHEEHDNHERWLLTYADLITLLLGLFVILYAMSKIDAGRYMQIVSALGGVFGSGQGSLMSGGTGIVESIAPLVLTERQRLERELTEALHVRAGSGPISISQNERGVTVHIMEELLFASGSAELKENSLAALDALAGVLRRVPNDIRVEGHTDDVPIHSARFPSNWHLSVSRAVNTGFYLIEAHGLNPEKVSVVGYSEYRPLLPNTSAENRARNRRVDIVIVTDVAHGAGTP